jgi:hypothetical protein
MSSYFNSTCPVENTAAIDQSSFWDGRFVPLLLLFHADSLTRASHSWDAHEIGWLIAGVTAAVSTVITFYNVWLHARNYYKPKEQRQVIRILFMPAVYAGAFRLLAIVMTKPADQRALLSGILLLLPLFPGIHLLQRLGRCVRVARCAYSK